MDHYTVGRVAFQARDVLWSKVSFKHLIVPEHDRLLDKAVKFQEMLCYALHRRKHTLINVLQKVDHYFTITNNSFSIVLQGVADFESRFIFIAGGDYGKQSDGGTFSTSTLYHFLEESEFTLP
jgi:hypothetical protein